MITLYFKFFYIKYLKFSRQRPEINEVDSSLQYIIITLKDLVYSQNCTMFSKLLQILLFLTLDFTLKLQ